MGLCFRFVYLIGVFEIIYFFCNDFLYCLVAIISLIWFGFLVLSKMGFKRNFFRTGELNLFMSFFFNTCKINFMCLSSPLVGCEVVHVGWVISFIVRSNFTWNLVCNHIANTQFYLTNWNPGRAASILELVREQSGLCHCMDCFTGWRLICNVFCLDFFNNRLPHSNKGTSGRTDSVVECFLEGKPIDC